MTYPYWRLSGFYFFFFASLGALSPYWGLYLQSLGFSPQQIGELMAILLATKVISPNVWAWVADHSARTMLVVRTGALMAFVWFLGLFWATTFWWIALFLFGFSFFWNAVLPQVETVTLNHLGAHKSRYGRIRLWGSLGFILFVIALGPIIERFGPGAAVPAVAAALFGVWLATMLIDEPKAAVGVRSSLSFFGVFKRPGVVALLCCCFLMQASHAPFYTFFSIYLSDYGYSKSLIGALWAFGVVCEIGVFYFMHRLQKRYPLAMILGFSFVATTVRWILVAAYPESVAVISFSQALHAVTFGAYHASAVQLIRGMFTGTHQHRGLALYGSVSFGVGGSVGSLLSGFAWAGIGPAATFLVAAAVAMLGALLAYRGVAPHERRFF